MSCRGRGQMADLFSIFFSELAYWDVFEIIGVHIRNFTNLRVALFLPIRMGKKKERCLLNSYRDKSR